MNKRTFIPAQAIIVIIIALFLTLSVFASPTEIIPDGFIGVYNAIDLTRMLPDDNYILLDDIDMTGVSFTPIGTSAAPFTGIFDGNGHTIEGLSISSNAPYSAMFAYADNAEIKDLKLENASIIINASSKTVYAAPICASASNGTVISGCSVSAVADITASADVYAAGICAYSNGAHIKSSVADVDISVTTTKNISSIGGIAGYLFADSSVTDCENYGSLSGISADESYIGGIIGISKRDLNNTSKAKPAVSDSFNFADISVSTKKNITVSCAGIAAKGENLTVSGCKNTGDITASCPVGAIAAGISGYQSRNNINECANLGNVSATSTGADAYAGGIVGEANVATISSSYNNGSVFASGKQSTNAGGIFGHGTQFNKIEYCYNSGVNLSEAGSNIGTLIGSASYNDTCTTLYTLESTSHPAIGNRIDENAVTLLSSTQMKNAESFEGFDFVNVWYMPTDSETGYPELVIFKPAEPVIILYGDVDNNGTVDSNDSVVLARYLAKWTGYDEINEEDSDLNSDTVVDSTDSVILSRHLAKWTGYDTLPLK